MQYKNIVFDMGNVLVDYNPENVIRRFSDDESLISEIKNRLFFSAEWILLDAGLLSEEEAIEKIIARMQSAQMKELTRKCFAHWHEYNVWAMPGMSEVLIRLKEKEHRIYVLSNASIRLPGCYRNFMPEWQLYDGLLFSAEEKCIKPQKIIYHKFFERFRLNPAECFFIDDLPQNIEGAKSCGMDGYVFKGNIAELKTLLRL
ncbi:MAG: HAD family phosphatase [Johnsonella sp.]|nr:HAD family phosphatase [Johnsonella sp.]